MIPPLNNADFEFTLEQELELIKLTREMQNASADDLKYIIENLARQLIVQKNIIKRMIKSS